MDDLRDHPEDDHRWLTYADLANARGISRASAVRLCRKHRWPKRQNNAGAVTVAVPGAFTVLAVLRIIRETVQRIIWRIARRVP